MLNARQLLTLQHLKDHRGFTEPEQFIEWARESLKKPNRISYWKEHQVWLPKSRGRKHIKDSYYQGIIDYFSNK